MFSSLLKAIAKVRFFLQKNEFFYGLCVAVVRLAEKWKQEGRTTGFSLLAFVMPLRYVSECVYFLFLTRRTQIPLERPKELLDSSLFS